MKQFWALGPKAAYGDRTFTSLHTAVGKALSSWEAIEIVQGRLFAKLSGSNDLLSPKSYATTNPTGDRAKRIKSSALDYWDHDEARLATIDQILNHYKEAASIRARIAHSVAILITDSQSRHAGIFLVPTPYASKGWDVEKINTGGPYGRPTDLPIDHAFTSGDVDRFSEKFDDLRRSIVDFIGAELDQGLAAELGAMTVAPESLPLEPTAH